MVSRRWRDSQGHPPPAVLLLHLERELDKCDAAHVQQHLDQCWTCRRQRERLQQGIYAFLDHRAEVLIPSVPPPPSTRSRIHQRFRDEEVARRASAATLAPVWLRIPAMRWAACVAAGVAAVLLFLLAVSPIAHPPVVTAAEFLQQARASGAEVRKNPRAVVRQRVEIRHGKRVIQREIVGGRNSEQSRAAALERELPAVMPIDWKDPLGVDGFADWCASLPRKRDAVTESEGTLTLTTTVPVPARVQLASLTVRRSDWHPIAKMVTLAGEPAVEVRELSYEVLPAMDLAPKLAALSRTAPVSVPAPMMVESTVPDLDDIELDLREALHRVRADVQEAPEIKREGGSLRLRAFVESVERGAAIREAVSQIPRLALEIHEPGSTVSVETEAVPQAPADELPVDYVTQPPLARQLWKFAGGIAPAERLLNETRETHLRLTAAAAALARLGERYGGADWRRLPAPARERVARIAADHAVAVRDHGRLYLLLLSPVLNEMLAREGVSPALASFPASGQNVGWQPVAKSILEDSRALQLAFRRLFVQDHVDEPLSLSAASLLREAVAAREALGEHIEQLCGSELAVNKNREP